MKIVLAANCVMLVIVVYAAGHLGGWSAGFNAGIDHCDAYEHNRHLAGER